MGSSFKYILIALALASLVPMSVRAQIEEDKLVAKWVYTLVPYLKWPENGDLVICTVGGGKVSEFIKALAAKDSRKSLAVETQTARSQFKRCKMLYISISETDVVEDIIDKVRDKPVVTVSNIDNFELRGGMIEFTQKSKRKLKINVRRAQEVGIKIDSDLLGIAEAVRN